MVEGRRTGPLGALVGAARADTEAFHPLTADDPEAFVDADYGDRFSAPQQHYYVEVDE